MQKAFALLISMLCLGHAFGQELQEIVERDRSGKGFRVLSYNVENLFDTIADGSNNDEEFLPTSKKQYGSMKYRHKVSNVAKVIRSVGGWQAPELVGLIEVENRTVLLDVVEHESLQKGNYRIAHFDSPDPRGIDVALLYDSTLFEVIHLQRIPITKERMRTRDILFVSLLVEKKDTLHVFVNHWSSRRGGKEKSSYKREIAAAELKHYTDSLQRFSQNSNILVMGDFNDSPRDKSVNLLCGADSWPLVNMCSAFGQNTGTYKYRGVWDVIDQIMVSPALVGGQSGLQVNDEQATVFNHAMLLVKDEKYGDVYPKRSWKGAYYNWGFSDHLPVFLDVSFTK